MADALDQKSLKEVLHYCPITGEFRWAKRTGKAGSRHKDGYTRIVLKKKEYMAHRLAWLYVHGNFPEHFIDHINGDRRDNRLSNLRTATAKQNSENRMLDPRNKSGHQCVFRRKHNGKWQAQLGHNGALLYLGLFDTADAAAEIVRAKRAELFTHDVGRATHG